MRWEDEQFVKVYTRDTGDWLALGWEAQSLFLLLLRKVDRAGLLHVGRSRLRGVAGMTGMPVDVVTRALPLLIDDGCVSECEAGYLIRNFIAAQEARQTDRARKALQRQKDRDIAATQGVHQASAADILSEIDRRESHEVTPAVTSGHTESHGVTLRRDETRVDESRSPASQEPAVPGRPELVLEAKNPKPKARKQVAEKPTDPRHAPLGLSLVALGWPHHGGRTAKALTALLAHADRMPPGMLPVGEFPAVEEILRRAGIARAWEGYPQAREIHELEANWGHFAQPQKPRGASALDVRRGSVRAELIDHTKPEEPF